MSGTLSTPGPTQICGSFFYDNTATVAAALDLQTALQVAVPQVTAAAQTAEAIAPTLAEALQSANYFLTGDLRGLPTVPGSVGTLWNNGGEIALVQ
ncbi:MULTISPECIES: hypothetical protein [unclassified Asaia]|uniref:hypothetical protein n=1 Tax=unclassified Asaia TaxID=2685023 RepID=UPI000F8D7205|nr:hypothetical protein [Asaia sp. W19]